MKDGMNMNKTGVFAVLILMVITLTAVATFSSYALEDNITSGTAATKNDIFYINYDNTSEVKSGSKAQIANMIKYQIGYTNTFKDAVNATITVHLSKGLSYVKDSSSIGVSDVNINSDGSSTLVFKRTILSSTLEKNNFSCLVTKEAKDNVTAYMTMTINNNKKDTPKLSNSVEDFTISYESDGNGIVNGESELVKYNESPNGVTVTPSAGFKFIGWISNNEILLEDGTKIATGDIISNNLINKIKVTKDITLTANFENKGDQVIVVYKDGTENIIQPFKVSRGEKHKLMELPKKDGYVGKNWTINGKTYNEGSTITVDEDMVITANYEFSSNNKSYKVIYKAKDKAIKSETVKDGTEIAIKSLNLSNTCIINEWKVNGEEYQAGSLLTISGNVTLTASSVCALESTNKKDVKNVNPLSSDSIKVDDNRFSGLKGTDNIVNLILYVVIALLVIVDSYLIIVNIKKRKKL